MTPRTLAGLAAVGFFAACSPPSDDPAAGGFFNGVRGVTSGTYDAEIRALKQDVATAETRNEALRAEQAALAAAISAAEADLVAAKRVLADQRRANPALDPAVSARVDAVLIMTATASDGRRRLAQLQKAVADARKLSADLARLSN